MVLTSGRSPANEGNRYISLCPRILRQIDGVSNEGHGVAQKNESGRMVGQVVCNLVEALVDCFVFILFDFLGRFIDHV